MGRSRDDGMPNSFCRLKAVMGRDLLTFFFLVLLLPRTFSYILCGWLSDGRDRGFSTLVW